jgi:uncharacterized repeat protein (TIGR04076 family)
MPYKIIEIEIVNVNEKCTIGHEVGNKVIFENDKIEGKLCLTALYAMLPKVFAMKYEAKFPWCNENPNYDFHSCPNRGNVRFKITRKDLGK